MALQLTTVASVLGPGPEQAPGPATHAELVDRLVAQVPETALGGDLALLSYAIPDDDPYKTVATYLNLVTGGRAHSVAITGQGVGSPFTALRVAKSYERTGVSSKSVLAIVESATLDGSDRPEYAAIDSGVFLTFDSTPGQRYVDAVFAVAEPRDLDARMAELAPEVGTLLIVLGPVAVEPQTVSNDRVHVHRAAVGSHCTSVWLALAHNFSRWLTEYDVIALVDTDRITGVSHVAVLRQRAEGAV